jgi:hypothetical protein
MKAVARLLDLLLLYVFFVVSLGGAGPSDASPHFSDYPAEPLFAGKPATPILSSKLQRSFRTQIRLGLKRGPNFAGRYRIIQWGCGSNCMVFVVADVKTGHVYDPPFRSLWLLDLSQREGSRERRGLEFKPSSRLLIVDGCPGESCGTYYYEWVGSEFKLIRSVNKRTGNGN